MSTTPTPPAGSPTPWQRWVNFWFAPGDPTMLGFMRIVTGLLCLYVHLAYCFDLQAFFGKDGWYSLAAINRERTEFPWMLTNLNDYDDIFKTARVPEFPHRRAAVMEFIRNLPESRTERMLTLRYLTNLQEMRNPQALREGLLYLNYVGAIDGEVRRGRLEVLANEAARAPGDEVNIPDFLKALPATGSPSRQETARDIDRLIDAFPKDVTQREFVINHLMEMDPNIRQAFLEFLRDLPEDAQARQQQIDFLEFWNNEARKAYRLGHPIFSIWFHITDPQAMAVAHGVILVIILLFTLGLWTRVMAVLTWLAVISYIHRTQHVLFGMDTMMNILLIYMMIGNAGAALSLDRLIQRYRAVRTSLRRTGTVDAATRAFLDRPPPSVSTAFAIRLIQVHFCFIYMASGLSKLKGTGWWNTNAFWDTLVNPEFCLVQFQWYEWLIRELVSNRLVYGLMAGGGVLFTLALEIALPFLVWTRLRPYMVIWACLFHLGIAIFMGLYLFALFMMTLLLAYLPGHLVREQLFGTVAAAKAALTLRFNNRLPQHQRAAALTKAFDFDDRVEVVDSPSKAETAVRVEAGNRELTGRPAARELFGMLAFPRLLRGLLAVPIIGHRLAAWFAPVSRDTSPAPIAPTNGKQPVGAK